MDDDINDELNSISCKRRSQAGSRTTAPTAAAGAVDYTSECSTLMAPYCRTVVAIANDSPLARSTSCFWRMTIANEPRRWHGQLKCHWWPSLYLNTSVYVQHWYHAWYSTLLLIEQTAIPFWAQTTYLVEFEWFVPKTGLQS